MPKIQTNIEISEAAKENESDLKNQQLQINLNYEMPNKKSIFNNNNNNNVNNNVNINNNNNNVNNN